MTDIGPGDVVAAKTAMSISKSFTPGGTGYEIAQGARAIVLSVNDRHEGVSTCATCGDNCGPGLDLVEYPLIAGVSWCECEWRKIGRGKDAIVAQFAHYLKQDAPVMTAETLRKLGIAR
jgi:hypothetical protein